MTKEAPEALEAHETLKGKFDREALKDALLAVFIRDGEIDPKQVDVAAAAAPYVATTP